MSIGQWQVSIVVACYMVLMIIVGGIYYKRNKSADAYLLGDRKLGVWVCAISAEASDMSGWLMLGLPGLVYVTGVGEAFWTAIGLILGTYINWLFVAKRLRIYTKKANNSITIPDYFSNRFRDSKKILMLFSAVFILFFFIIYFASGFAACGKLFSAVFGLDYTLMMIISALVIIAYSFVGGFLAVSTTDLIQGILMFFALLTVVIVGILTVGGGQIPQNIGSINGFLNIWGANDPTTNTFSEFSVLKIISILAWGLGYFGIPHVLIRFMAIEEQNKLSHSRRIAMVWVIVSLAAAILIGVIGRSYFGGEFLGAQSETIFVQLSIALLPALVTGVMVSAVLAAAMSTSDSQLLVVSSAISHNFYCYIKRLFTKQAASQKELLLVARITVIASSLVAIFFALDENSSVFKIVSYAWAGFGATFGPVILLSLFWVRMNKWGALAGMISGALTVVVWKEWLNPIGGIFKLYELLPAFIIATVMIFVVSLLTPKPSDEIVEEFMAVNDEV